MKTPYRICRKCHHREACTVPCAFADAYINQDGKVYERTGTNDTLIMVSPSRQVNQTSLYQISGNQDDGTKTIEALFSTLNETPFEHFTPDHTTTKIFIHRFFQGWKFKDIAARLELNSEGEARKIYARACERIEKALMILDERQKVNHQAIKALATSKADQLPQRQKYYILFTLFRLTTPEIAAMFKVSKGTVKTAIQTVSKQIRANDLLFTDIAHPEQWTAKVKVKRDKALATGRTKKEITA